MMIHFISVEPAYPENIGSAARAIKTMGFDSLILVNPCNHLAQQARWLAHGSNDILENAILYNSFSEAIKDIDFVIGTSSKARSVKNDYYPSEKITFLIKEKKGGLKNMALVFGGEESGLYNRILERIAIMKDDDVNLTHSVCNRLIAKD